jgi:uncharacterized membrane protein HdeD (DUF308 family)
MSNLTAAAKSGGKRMTAFGVIAISLGLLAMLAPVSAGVSLAMVLGGLVVVSGIIRMLWAFQSDRLGRGVWMLAVGGLTLICGLALLAHPLFASGVLTIVLVAYLILDGVSEVVVGFGRPGDGGGWLILGGIVSIVLGGMMWAQYPLSGAWAMGMLLGIKLFLVGLTMITGGSAGRSMAAAQTSTKTNTKKKL